MSAVDRAQRGCAMARPGAAMPGTRASTVLATAAGALALVACLASIGLDAPARAQRATPRHLDRDRGQPDGKRANHLVVVRHG